MDDNSFVAGQQPWLERLGNLRNVVRQEMVGRQLARHVPAPPARVLDVGAGQGTQALRLAALGHVVTAVEPDARMRHAFHEAAALLDPASRARVRLVAGDLSGMLEATGGQSFDVVLCHGVLMYLPSMRPAVVALAAAVGPGGILSLVSRNAAAMAWRPVSRHRWADALAMLDELDAAAAEGRDARYRNEIGVDARADTLEALVDEIQSVGLTIDEWYGVRVSSDAASVDEPTPPQDELEVLLDVEERLGRTDPYRSLGTLLHVIARRPAT